MSRAVPAGRRPLVAHVITKLAVGGAQQTALDLCEGLAGDGWETVLLAGPEIDVEGSLAGESARRGIRVVQVPHLRRAVRPLRDLAATLWLLRWFRHHAPAIVHTHSSKAGALGRLAARLGGVPAIVHTVHGWSFTPQTSPVLRATVVAVERVLARFTSTLVVVTEVDRSAGLAAGIGRADQYELIHNGLDLRAFSAGRAGYDSVRLELGLPLATKLVGTVGRLAEQKDPMAMVEAMALVLDREPATAFVWVGDGPLRPKLEERIAQLGLHGRFIITGVRADVPRWLSALDVFVLSSRWEGLPRSATEAMAAGVPVIATAVDGVVELVEDGRTGLTVPTGDPELLADRVGKVLNQPELALALAKAGQIRAEAFDRATMISRFDSLYHRLCMDGEGDRPLRVTHVITGLGFGGAERALERLVVSDGSPDVSHHVISLGADGPVGESLRRAGIPVGHAGLRPRVPGPRAVVRLRRLIRASEPDVVQTWLYHGDLVGGFVARSLRLPVVWNVRQGMFEAATTRRPTRAVARACARVSRWLPDAIVANSESGRQAHIGAGFDGARMRLITNGIDVERFRPDPAASEAIRAELGLAADAIIIGMVARVDPAKDHATFLEAVALARLVHPDLRVVLAGKGIDGDAAVELLVTRLGLGDVVVRLRPRHDIERLTAAFDLAVLSSRGEGFPNAVAEAMACGVPVVASDVGDTRALIGDAGLVVPPGDVASLRAAIVDLLGRDPADRAAVGARGRARVVERFSFDIMRDRYLQVWADALNRS